MIVVDSNILAYWLLPGDNTELIERLWKKDSSWVAPSLWRSEFRNILFVFMRQQKIDLMEARMIMEEAEQIMGNKDYQVSSRTVLKLAHDSGCSAYDCEFVALARRFKVMLVTADQQILRQFPETAIAPAQFLGEI